MRRATILRFYLLRLFLTTLGASLGLFALILELVDLFEPLALPRPGMPRCFPC
jgi:hypothetical protein